MKRRLSVQLIVGVVAMIGLLLGTVVASEAWHGGFRGHVFVGPRVFIGPSLWWGDPYWWGYPYSYAPPVAIESPPQAYIEAQPPPQYWYYCQNPQGYYPYVQQCPAGWQQVMPSPPLQSGPR